MANDFNPNMLGFSNGLSELGLEQSGDARAPVDLIEVAGTVKWFDVAKGYGFIIPDNGMADILLHATVLRLMGLDNRRLEIPGRRRLEIDWGQPILDIFA